MIHNSNLKEFYAEVLVNLLSASCDDAGQVSDPAQSGAQLLVARMRAQN